MKRFGHKQQVLINDYKKAFGGESGANVLKDLKSRCPLLTDGVDLSKGVDEKVLLIMTGREDVVKYIYKMRGKDPLEERDEIAKGE